MSYIHVQLYLRLEN